MAGTPNTQASDLTGRQREAGVKKKEEELARRRDEITMASQAAAIALETEVVDLSVTVPVTLSEEEVEVNEQEVVIRVNTDLNTTFGDRTYELKVGQKYKLPKHIADHLDSKGVVWH